MSKFQLILTVVFGLFILIAIAVFATTRSTAGKNAPNLVLWGTIDRVIMDKFVSDAGSTNKETVNITYVEKDPKYFEQNLVEALASGVGPDLALVPDDLILRQEDKFYVIPFANYSERTFRDSFIQGGEIYLTPAGVLALPFAVDPMVMYWNRDIFSGAGLAKEPTSWNEFFSLAPKLTKKDNAGNILQSIAALGEMKNVDHSKEILVNLIMQAGNPIIARGTQGRPAVVLEEKFNAPLVPAEEALRFYTEFANPTKTSYSWNRVLPTSFNAFLGGRLAVYFGFSSEISSIRAKNPNLNFDVALVPQANGSLPITYGSFLGLAILKTTKNLVPAFNAINTLTSAPLLAQWTLGSGLPPVRRDLLVDKPGDAYKSVFYSAALMSRSWLDPNPTVTTQLFTNMVEDVTSGKYMISESVKNTSNNMKNLLR